jgi:hypothetical protein
MKQILYITLCFFTSLSGYAQQNFTIRGYVKDKNTGEVLIGATIYEKSLYKGTVTNGYGFYSFSLPTGKYTINFSYLGYESFDFEINLMQNISKDIFLENSSVNLESITVTAESSTKPLAINEFSTEKLTMKNIRQLPAMFGEADVIKAIQLQSGVKTLGDGSSGMFVRGGSSDQNLILIDEAPIYNPSHLFGLISVFNPDALNHVDLYKSNMPAQYGGRVSSVIDCKMKEGNMYDYDFSAGLSPFSTILSANGPIIKEKSSFFISGRKSLIDIFFKPGPNLALVPVFYDLNLKINTKIGKNDRLFVSFYNGKDLLESVDGFYNKWGNTSGTLRWNRSLGSKLFLNTSFIISDYQNYLEFKDEGRNYKWLTGLNDMNLKFDLSYYLRPGNVIKVGAGSIYHQFIPGETADTLQSIPRIQAFEHAFYILNDIELLDWIGLNYGLRLSAFQNYGKATWFDYNEQYLPIKTNANQERVYQTYIYAEPRFSTNIKFSPDYSLKLAYARNVQYMQILQNNSLSYSSLETWFPANPNIKPIVVDAVSAGWFQNLSKRYFLSLELYYKTYQNQIDYIDHARLVNNPYIEGEIREGTATAYGAEFNLKREIGRLTGTISYTYSRALRKINDLNGNKEYNSPYDIPHDFRITTNFKINEKWNFNTAWMYMSGRPVTLPIGFYSYQRNTVPIYSDRNSSRFPDYHRLDISFNYEPEKQTDRINWTMNFGIYNLYAKKNPLGYEFDSDYSTGQIKVYQYTLFTILPNFSIKVEF